MKIFSEAKEILFLLQKASNSYYNEAISIITDFEYDHKRDRLIYLYEKELIPNKSFDIDLVKSIEEYLNQVGAPITASEWKKADHKNLMASLNKVNTEEEFINWEKEINDQYYVIFDKMDGGSIDLVYKDSKLIQAITRGNGVTGSDMLQNVLKMKNVKSVIQDFTGNLYGEVFILREDFEKLNQLSDHEYKNPRNTATGLQKSLDGENVELLSIYFYDIHNDNIEYETEEEKLKTIENMGLKTCFWKKVIVKEAIEDFYKYQNEVRVNLPYDVDGLVIRANSVKKQKDHGMLGGKPKAKIAWKFKPMEKETELTNVIWHVGNSRRITPIAILKPTPMGGVTVRRSTLHNVDRFKLLELKKDCKILLIRANDVIPQILKNLGEGTEQFKTPDNCPECGCKTEIQGKFLICKNDECSGLGTGNLERWVNVLDIDSLGPKIIQMLYDRNLVREPADFYKLTIDQISVLDRMGIRSATKIIKNLKSKMQLTLPEFIAGLNMSNFSKETAEALINSGYNDIIKIINAQEDDLIKVKGIAEKTALQIKKGLASKFTIMKNLFDIGITIKEPEKIQFDSNKLQGISFCFTGAINAVKPNGKRYTRDDMHNLVIKNSGIVEESVKKGLTYLVVVDPSTNSSKAQKARELGTRILSENDFFQMIG
ncbi:MAG: NAD-dependent DNA ligase LigA [Candidatus Nanoarchaeia archaeon]|nr:NAD-dependent DNA ligase LigA [Candidatus Nanoarchaeia archaeon]